ncbi:MAG: YbjN domain-containing protein, partial [Thermostichales cyanobacterium SZTDM-1c_bins_54]
MTQLVSPEPSLDSLALDTELPLSIQDQVVTAISALTSDPIYENHQSGHTWKFTYGTVTVYVHLSGEASSDIFTVWAPVLNLPVSKQEALYATLLEKNWSETL